MTAVALYRDNIALERNTLPIQFFYFGGKNGNIYLKSKQLIILLSERYFAQRFPRTVLSAGRKSGQKEQTSK